MNFKTYYLLTEAKQDIVNLGYPEIVATIFYQQFGKLAYLLAKWFKDYKDPTGDRPNWWLQATSSWRETPSLWDLTTLYAATKDINSYNQALEKLELTPQDYVDLDEQREALKSQIERKLLGDYFFENDFIKEIISKTITDLKPYSQLNFSAAHDKYDKKRIFKEREALKTYPNGYKWIDTGRRCQLVGKLMKNCGSAGLMSNDPDRTVLTLFDSRNKPHVVITYSPNEKRLSSEEGAGSTEAKSKYHDYILDLAKFLGATLDVNRSKSNFLKVKYLLSDLAQNLEQIGDPNDIYHSYFKFNAKNKVYYTNAATVVSEEDVQKMIQGVKSGKITLKNDQNNPIKNVFNYSNQPLLTYHGIQYTPIQQFKA